MMDKSKSVSFLIYGSLGAFLMISDVVAQSSKKSYVPLIFHTETRQIKTSVCLEIIEHKSNKNWVEFKKSRKALDQRIVFVMNAIIQNNSKALYELSHTQNGRDVEKFEEQKTAFFQQFKNIEIDSIPYYYELGNLVIYYLKLKFSDKDFFVPFIFEYDIDGTLRFLPYRSEFLSYRFLNDWFNSPWGPSKSKKTYQCRGNQIEKATHKIQFDGLNSKVSGLDSPMLYMFGASVNLSKHGGVIKKLFSTMKSSLRNKEISSFVSHLTLEGGNRLKDWFVSSNEDEQKKYITWFDEQRPFYIFDAFPILIVYAKNTTGLVQVFYFLNSKKNLLLWVNSSHVTKIDKLFKFAPFRSSASMEKPFENLRTSH